MFNDLQGKTVLITGASSGIGAAVAAANQVRTSMGTSVDCSCGTQVYKLVFRRSSQCLCECRGQT